jgi:hypothetical protein
LLQHHNISRLPNVEDEISAKRKFKAYLIGYFHIDIADVRTAEGKLLFMFVAIDCISKFAVVYLLICPSNACWLSCQTTGNGCIKLSKDNPAR